MLAGASGSGKTTLLNLLGGIDHPDSGTIKIDNQDITKFKKQQKSQFYRKKVSFVFQDFYLQPFLTVLENICLPGVFANLNRQRRLAIANDLVKILDLETVQNHLASEISGGQAERACIARAMFMRPSIILADEPTNNLDAHNIDKVLFAFKTLQQRLNTTIIISSHDDRVEKYANRKITIRDGNVS